MTDQAVDVLGILKVVVLIFVAVARMALRAAGFVAWNGDAEVIENVVLAVVAARCNVNDVRRETFPLEVCCFEHFVRQLAVAIQAGLRAFVVVLGEVAGVQFFGLGDSAGNGITVNDVDFAVAVEVFFGIFNAILVQIPAVDSCLLYTSPSPRDL